MPTEAAPPPVLSAGVVSLVRYRGGETPRLLAAVSESVEHLRPWMPWAAAEPTFDGLDEFVSRAMSQWTSGDAFNYWFSYDDSLDVVGGGGLHRRIGAGTLEIGYWVHAGWTRRGIATAAATALTNAGLALRGVDRVEIRCDEANRASAAVPRRLGYRLEETFDDPITAPGELGRCMVWATDTSSWTPAP
ncbi:MAG TPA: GNAT family protein [Acidimicrobiales bacterium]|jgi:RimJ/RimL family protein N-acetyltransferase|nr:GNAT family protein [Acidimicrobiales bacterium]